MSEFTNTLRCHDDERLYTEADNLLCDAANHIDKVESELATLKQELQASRDATPVPASEGIAAKEEYIELMEGGDELDSLERLRFFCSLAMTGQDWLDVEPFFDDIKSDMMKDQS